MNTASRRHFRAKRERKLALQCVCVSGLVFVLLVVGISLHSLIASDPPAVVRQQFLATDAATTARHQEKPASTAHLMGNDQPGTSSSSSSSSAGHQATDLPPPDTATTIRDYIDFVPTTTIAATTRPPTLLTTLQIQTKSVSSSPPTIVTAASHERSINKNASTTANATNDSTAQHGPAFNSSNPEHLAARAFPFRSRRGGGPGRVPPRQLASMTNTVGMLDMDTPEDLVNSTPTTDRCGPHAARTEAGLYSGSPIDSVVSVALDFDSRDAAVHELSRIYLAGADSSEYFTFLADHKASTSNLDGSTESSGSGGVTCEAEVPFALDVVYTYVNDSSPSHRAARNESSQSFAADTMRYRDWNELLYSMRTVYRRAMVDGLVRKVHIVVAHQDQVPHWLNASDPRISIVLHSQIFPADEPDALPTFNSHAIESVLHRIPGLSRFFVYFNNDMLWGRRVSFFDYFRPISAERQQHREERLRRMGCGGVVPTDNETRVTVMFEPILYFENTEGPGECGVKSTFPVAQAVHEHAAVTKALSHTLSADNTSPHIPCDAVPLRAASMYGFMCRQRVDVPRGPGRPFVVSKAELWRRFVNFNKAVLFRRIDGYWPTHSFAHIPRLMDRQLQQQMEERDFADIARATRGTRNRETRVFWTTYAFAYYALSHRRALDAEVEVEMGRWNRRDINVTDADVLPPLGPLVDYKNGELPLEHQFNPDLAAVALQAATQPPPGATQNASVIKELLGSAAFVSASHSLNFGLVKLDRKPGMYYFCMMRSAVALRKCLNELVDRMQLFVTVNDDIPRIPLYPRPGFNVVDLMKRFLETVSGNAPPSPWERPNVTIGFHRAAENVNGVVPSRRTFDEAFAAAQKRPKAPRNATAPLSSSLGSNVSSERKHLVTGSQDRVSGELSNNTHRDTTAKATTATAEMDSSSSAVGHKKRAVRPDDAPTATSFDLMFLAVN